MHIYTFAIVTMHIYTVTVTVYTIILLISHFSPFFLSLFSVQNELGLKLLLPYLLFPQIHTNTPTHKHIHTDKSTHRYTNTPTRTNQQRDKLVLCWLLVDQWIGVGARLEFVSRWEWVLMLVDWCWRVRSVLVGQWSPCLRVLILVVLVVEIGACGG